jgi:hypothetical protein
MTERARFTPFTRDDWNGYAGATPLPDGAEPEGAETTVADCPAAAALDDEGGPSFPFYAILDGGGDGAEGGTIALTYNALTVSGYPVSYRRTFPAGTTVAAARRYANDLPRDTAHEDLLAAGFDYEGPNEEDAEREAAEHNPREALRAAEAALAAARAVVAAVQPIAHWKGAALAAEAVKAAERAVAAARRALPGDEGPRP